MKPFFNQTTISALLANNTVTKEQDNIQIIAIFAIRYKLSILVVNSVLDPELVNQIINSEQTK